MIQTTKQGDVLSSGTVDGFYLEFDPSVKSYTLKIGIGTSPSSIDSRYKIVFNAGANSYNMEKGD